MESSSRQPVQNNLLLDTCRHSSENSFTLCNGDMDFGSFTPLTPQDLFLPMGGFLRTFLFLAKSLGVGLFSLSRMDIVDELVAESL